MSNVHTLWAISHVPTPGAMSHVHTPGGVGHFRGPGWSPSEVQVGNMSGIESPQAQTSFGGPGTHLGGILRPMEAEGRLNAGLSEGGALRNFIYVLPIWALRLGL